MKSLRSIPLQEVRRRMRKCKKCKVWNVGGWSVFDDAKGRRMYITDDYNHKPLSFFDFRSTTSFVPNQNVWIHPFMGSEVSD